MTTQKKKENITDLPLRDLPSTNQKPPHKPTTQDRQVVRNYAEAGVSEDDIATIFEISLEELQKFYPDELRIGKAVSRATLTRTLFAIATEPGAKGQIAACNLWLKLQGQGLNESDPDKDKGKKEALKDAANEIASEGSVFATAKPPASQKDGE